MRINVFTEKSEIANIKKFLKIQNGIFARNAEIKQFISLCLKWPPNLDQGSLFLLTTTNQTKNSLVSSNEG